jgi:Mn-dependent DtxR family transcriptional regulator
MIDARHRYPWEPIEEAFLLRAKTEGTRHKIIARHLKRTPRSVDQMVYKLKEEGRL